MKSFFGIILQPGPWLNIVYNLISFPLGIFYFVFLLTWLLLGFGLLIIWVGLLFLLSAMFIWWYFAAFERLLAILFCRVKIDKMKKDIDKNLSVWNKFKAHMSHPVTWKSLAFLFMKFPVGIFQFVVTISLISVVLSLISAPFTYTYWEINIGTIEILSLPLALASFVVGLILLFAVLHLFSFMGKILGQLAVVMLGDESQQVEK